MWFALAGCRACKTGEVGGRLVSTGAAGNWVLESGHCYSGQREHYFGAAVFGPEGSGIAVNLVKDQVRGWTVTVNVADTCKAGPEKPKCSAIALTQDQCAVFEVEVHNTNMTINDVTCVDGSVTLDCKVGEGGVIKGSLNLDNCH